MHTVDKYFIFYKDIGKISNNPTTLIPMVRLLSDIIFCGLNQMFAVVFSDAYGIIPHFYLKKIV